MDHVRVSFIKGDSVSKDINVVALVKGEERFIFLFNDSQKSETLRTLGRYASDPQLNFSWYDAAVLSQKVRNTGVPLPPVADQTTGQDLVGQRWREPSVPDWSPNEE